MKASEKVKNKMKVADLGRESISKKLERFQRFKGLEQYAERKESTGLVMQIWRTSRTSRR